MARHPSNIILLTCDAFGVLPPVSQLTIPQAMYHFINGYTSKVSGTEVGVKVPTATFSACFGEPFLVWHPFKYAEMLAQQLEKHKVNVWLVNTGWTGGSASDQKASRIPLKYTRAMIDAIHSGELAKAAKVKMPVFNLLVPETVSNVPSHLLIPSKNWNNEEDYKKQLNHVAALFNKNFAKYTEDGKKYVHTMELCSTGGPLL